MILLARILSPHDFGLVATVLALVGFAPVLIDLGTTDAAIQKPRITPTEISTLFWLNIAIGICFTVVFVASSEIVASAFGQPELTEIMLVMSLTFVLTAMSVQYIGLMRRALHFRQIAIVETTGNAVGSIVGIAMALTGWGYWSLLARPILAACLIAIGVRICCPWRPSRPR